MGDRVCTRGVRLGQKGSALRHPVTNLQRFQVTKLVDEHDLCVILPHVYEPNHFVCAQYCISKTVYPRGEISRVSGVPMVVLRAKPRSKPTRRVVICQGRIFQRKKKQ